MHHCSAKFHASLLSFDEQGIKALQTLCDASSRRRDARRRVSHLVSMLSISLTYGSWSDHAAVSASRITAVASLSRCSEV